MRTILLPIYHGIRARNFFRTDTYNILVRDGGTRIVVVAPPAKCEFYREEFPELNVFFEPLEIVSEPPFGQFLYKLGVNLLNTNTIRLKQRLQYLKDGNYPRFLLWRFLNRTIGRLPVTRLLIRLLDRFVVSDPGVEALLNKYRPDLVIVPDIVFPADRIFLRTAKRMGFFVVGMIRSWDNLTAKGVIQVLPEKLIVHSHIMYEEAVRLAGMPEEDIYISGSPQFDSHFRVRSLSREDFLKDLGVPANRRIVLCAPFFNDYTNSAVAIINSLTGAIEGGRLPRDLHILVRYRPSNKEIPAGRLRASRHLTVTRPCEHHFIVKNLQSPTDDYEYSQRDVDLLLNSLAYCSVVINTISSLSIDASAFDKPVINIRFDAEPICPPHLSVKPFLKDHDHYEAIERTGGIRFAWNMDALIELVNLYIENPYLDELGRERIRREQIEFMDGLSGRRVAEYILNLLNERESSQTTARVFQRRTAALSRG